MAYQEQTWVDKTPSTPGTRITKARMDHIEQGVKEAHDLAESGGSLTVVTSNTTIPAGSTVGELAGYINTSASPIVVSGTTLEAGAWGVWTWIGGSWLLLNSSGSGEPDTEAPTAPTNLSVTPGANTATLTWTAATDNTGVAGYEARTQKAGDIWSTWATVTSGGDVTGLTPLSNYTVEVRAFDFAGNRGGAASDAFTTTALPLTGDVVDEFTDTDGTSLIGRTTTSGGKTWVTNGSTNIISGWGGNDLQVWSNQATRASGVTSNSVARIAVDPGSISVAVDYSVTNRYAIAIGVGQQGGTNPTSTLHLTHQTSGGTPGMTLLHCHLPGGGVVSLTSVGYYATPPTAGRVELEWDASTNIATVRVDGTPVITTSALSGLTTGYVAIGIGNTAGTTLDDLAVNYL